MNKIVANGVLDKLFHEQYDGTTKKVDFENRKIIYIPNHDIPTSAPVGAQSYGINQLLTRVRIDDF